ncbi:MAG: HIT family protein [Henriciella sp.]|nr:HIT family protein [Henriciella sp.]
MTDYNPTFLKFKGPETQIAAYEYWSVLVRPKQCTMGALVLIANGPETQFSKLSSQAFTEQARVIKDIEQVLSAKFGYDKINYLMLMMVDPNVHYHVIPRYAGPVTYENWTLTDGGWPGQPDLAVGSADGELVASLTRSLKSAWPDASRTP